MIKIYKIDSMNYTPFDPNFDQGDFEYLVSAGLSITENPKEADLFAAYDTKKLKRFMLKNPFKKPILLWTNEPRLSQIKQHTYRPYWLLPKVNVMNVYTGEVFINNVTYQKKRFTAASALEFLPANFELDNRRVAALMSYYNAGRNSALFIDGVNIDLVRKRSDIGIYGHKNNLLDIFGKGWPAGMSKEDSRSGAWSNRKSELLKEYHFNLCFENTVAPKYITEKIWDSIQNYCLPIYYGGTPSTIYEIFPRESFIDYADYEDPKTLFQAIASMTTAEFIGRMNACLNVYNQFAEKPAIFWQDSRKQVLDNIVNKCKVLTATK